MLRLPALLSLYFIYLYIGQQVLLLFLVQDNVPAATQEAYDASSIISSDNQPKTSQRHRSFVAYLRLSSNTTSMFRAPFEAQRTHKIRVQGSNNSPE
jgi:hypothetical protein